MASMVASGLGLDRAVGTALVRLVANSIRQRVDNQVTETSAKIIDFRTYTAGRLARSERVPDDIYSTAVLTALTTACHLWTFLAWDPFALLGAPAPKQEPHEYP